MIGALGVDGRSKIRWGLANLTVGALALAAIFTGFGCAQKTVDDRATLNSALTDATSAGPMPGAKEITRGVNGCKPDDLGLDHAPAEGTVDYRLDDARADVPDWYRQRWSASGWDLVDGELAVAKKQFGGQFVTVGIRDLRRDSAVVEVYVQMSSPAPC